MLQAKYRIANEAGKIFFVNCLWLIKLKIRILRIQDYFSKIRKLRRIRKSGVTIYISAEIKLDVLLEWVVI